MCQQQDPTYDICSDAADKHVGNKCMAVAIVKQGTSNLVPSEINIQKAQTHLSFVFAITL
jgi:hypothetical protein